METSVEFINDVQFKVVTIRGEELVGNLLTIPAKTDEIKKQVANTVKQCFDTSESCSQAISWIQNVVIESAPMILLGVAFEFTIKPIEAQRRRIGKRIRELREEKGMSARELAFLCRVDPSNLSKIEQGKHAAGLDVLNRIAYFLDAEVQINPKSAEGSCHRSASYRIYDNMQ